MDPATMMLLGKAGMAVYQGIQGKSKQKEAERAAQRAAAKMRAIEEENIVGGLQVPTLGAELARQELGQQVATSVEALRSAGAAGVLGGIPSLVDVSTDKALEIAAGLQEAEYQRDKFVLQQEQALEGRRVAREMSLAGMELQGAQAAVAEGKMAQQEALKLAAEGLTGFAEMKLKYSDLYPQQTREGTMQEYIASEQQKADNDFTGKRLEPSQAVGLSMTDEQFKSIPELNTPGYYGVFTGSENTFNRAKITSPYQSERFASGSPTGEAAMVEGFAQPEPVSVPTADQTFKKPLPIKPIGMTGTAPSPVPLPMFNRPLPMAPLGMTGTAPSPVPLPIFNKPLPPRPLGMSSVPVPDPYYSFDSGSPTGEAAMVGGFPAQENAVVIDRVTGLPVLKQYPNSFPIMPPGLR